MERALGGTGSPSKLQVENLINPCRYSSLAYNVKEIVSVQSLQPNVKCFVSLSFLRYHIPRYFLKTGENLLVIMEEIGGDPLQITVNTMSITRIYSSVSELSTPSLLSREKHPAIHLRCQKGKHITDIEFASYGNSHEDCIESGQNCHGSCHAEISEFVVKNVNFSTSKATC